MKITAQPQPNPKDLLRKAESEAKAGDEEKAIDLFQSCIQEYLKTRMPFKALASAKVARSVLGCHPKTHAMLMKILLSMGLTGDACKEFSESSKVWKKNEASLLTGLSMEEFMDVLDIMQLIRFKKGACVVKQRDKGEDIYLLISGSLEVIRDGERISLMHPGDVFGELGFFSQEGRSATVRAMEKCELTRIPSRKLKLLCSRNPGLGRSLEALYEERILRKAREDLRLTPLFNLTADTHNTCHFPKGAQISFDNTAEDVTIIKHGIVEISFDDKGLAIKRFLRPGNVLERFDGTARANTDVEVIRTRIDFTGSGKKGDEA